MRHIFRGVVTGAVALLASLATNYMLKGRLEWSFSLSVVFGILIGYLIVVTLFPLLKRQAMKTTERDKNQGE